MLLFLFLLGVWFCYLDYRDWRIHDTTLPRIVGIVFIGGSILGIFGVNIWRGGPLDPRRDSKVEDEQCNLETLERFGPFAVVFEEGDLPVPGHLPLLRMCDDDECLVVFGRIKRALNTSKADHAIRVMLEDRNWRPHLVAAVGLTIRGTQDQNVDLLWAAMDSGSWVSPQLAVVARALDSNLRSTRGHESSLAVSSRLRISTAL